MEFGLTKLTATPVNGKLHGVEIELHPLTLKDWGRIEQDMRTRIISAAAESCRDMGAEQRRTIMREAHKEAAATSLTSEDAKKGLFSSMDTMLLVVYLSLRKSESKITIDRVDQMIGNDLDALTKMTEVIFNLSFPDMDAADEKNSNRGQAEASQ